MNATIKLENVNHFPVLLKEVISIISPLYGGTFIDCTFGQGGYSKKILENNNNKVFAIDRDCSSTKIVNQFKKKYQNRFEFENRKFSEILNIEQNIENLKGIIFDLGYSTTQIKDPEKGLSFNNKGRLNMKMGLNKFSADDVVNKLGQKELAKIFKVFGEENSSKIISKRIISFRKSKNIQTEDLTSQQIDNLLLVLDEESNIQVANLVRFALFTGMRRGEIFNLKWSDINFQKKIIRIRNPKGGQDVTIPLNEPTEKVLTTHPNIGSDYVFPGLNGGRRNNCTRPMKRIKEKADLPDDFRMFHGLRHVYASQLASSGKVDLYTLQTLMTHKSPLMTQRYAHLRNDTLIQASNVISDLIKQEKEVIEIEQHRTKNSG